MATIDDLNDAAQVLATPETDGDGTEMAAFMIRIPRALLDTIAGGDTRSRVLVADWLKPAIDAKD